MQIVKRDKHSSISSIILTTKEEFNAISKVAYTMNLKKRSKKEEAKSFSFRME